MVVTTSQIKVYMQMPKVHGADNVTDPIHKTEI